MGLSKFGAALKVIAPEVLFTLTVAESALGLRVHVEVSFAVRVPTVV
jgi:hypothetical protein